MARVSSTSPEWDGWSVKNMGHPAPVPGKEHRVRVRGRRGEVAEGSAVYG
jgi:hypothetical protein